jgi:hypothetical protein
MKLVFTPEAERQAIEMDTWWREHRAGARDLFARELADVLKLIVGIPTVGAAHITKSGKVLRRVLMPKTRNHVYFQVDESRELITVHAIWGAPRGRGPRL